MNELMSKFLERNDIREYISATTLDDAVTLPAFMYTGKEMHQLDLDLIIAKTWQCVAHKSDLQNNGDLMVTEVANKPIIVLRDHSGELRAFYNVCKHRAGPLALQDGNVKVLSCKYHGWSYQLSGELRTAPEMNDTPNFDRCSIHLDSIRVDEWQGFIFVNLDPQTNPLAQYLSGIKELIEPIDLSTMNYHRRDEYVAKCNWKTYMDNYLEGYHLPHVHPGLNQLLDYSSYQTHLFEHYSYQYSPLNDTGNFYGKGKAHYFCLFPNLMLNILPGRCQVNIVIPISDNECKVVFDYYYNDIESNRTQKMIAEDLEFSDQVQDEDIEICEHVQRGLESGSYHQGRLCVRQEQCLWHYQEMIWQAFRQALES